MSWLNTCASRQARHKCIVSYMHIYINVYMYVCIYVYIRICIHKKHGNGESAHVKLRPGGTKSLWLLFKPPLTLPAWATGEKKRVAAATMHVANNSDSASPSCRPPCRRRSRRSKRGREEAEGAAAASAIPRDVNRIEAEQGGIGRADADLRGWLSGTAPGDQRGRQAG